MNADLYCIIAGEDVTIRPIRATDTAMEAEFIRQLSPETKYYRFLGGIRELSPAALAKLCDVDGKQSMAYVATVQRNGRETEIGVSRYAPDSDSKVHEMAVTVADEWQCCGLGATLMKQLIQSAQDNGVKKLYSTDFAENAAMKALARQFGMSANPDPNEPRQVTYSLIL